MCVSLCVCVCVSVFANVFQNCLMLTLNIYTSVLRSVLEGGKKQNVYLLAPHCSFFFLSTISCISLKSRYSVIVKQHCHHLMCTTDITVTSLHGLAVSNSEEQDRQAHCSLMVTAKELSLAEIEQTDQCVTARTVAFYTIEFKVSAAVKPGGAPPVLWLHTAYNPDRMKPCTQLR